MGDLILMTDVVLEGFAERLREAREARFDTQKEFADLLGLVDQTYRKYEQGRAMPKYPTLQKICAILNVDMNELLYGTRKRKRATDPANFDPIPLRRKR